MKKTENKILKSLLTNPILIIAYWIFLYELASVCKYGRYKNNMAMLIASFIAIILIIVYISIKIAKEKKDEFTKDTEVKGLNYIWIVIIISLTFFYGFNIYKSGTNYGGKLAWVIEKIKNERKVEFVHNNIFEHGVEGIFKDISEKYTIPDELYMSDNFELKFSSDGTITSFDTYIYGKNSDGEDKSFLVTYNKNKSDKIILKLNGHINANYNKNKRIEPLIKTVNVIKFENIINKLNEANYGLSYFGKRSFGYNTEGVIDINGYGEEYPLEEALYEIIGYTVSIYVPGKEMEITPLRYNLITDEIFDENDINEEQNQFNEEEEDGFSNSKQFLTKEIGYKLDEIDYASGSIFYNLSKTNNGGNSWEVINEDPFNGAVGGISCIKFIDENVGFIGISRSGGTNGEMYYTNDGGISFKIVNYELVEVKLDNGTLIKPYDFPKDVYEENGLLYMLVGQGTDGDYNGNNSVLYVSKDNGLTWEYIKELKKQ